MSKRARQYIGILAAVAAYYVIHEGAHLIYALTIHIDRDALQDQNSCSRWRRV